jgi:hypothetical protein
MSNYTSNMTIENLFQNELQQGEKILWTGQPDPSILFTRYDVFLIPFSLLWGGFTIFWEIGVLSWGTPTFFALWGIPFVLIGLYLIFGRFIYKNYQKKKTYYAVTNQRVLILSGFNSRNLQAEFIKQISAINKDVRANGSGTIRFGNVPYGLYV